MSKVTAADVTTRLVLGLLATHVYFPGALGKLCFWMISSGRTGSPCSNICWSRNQLKVAVGLDTVEHDRLKLEPDWMN